MPKTFVRILGSFLLLGSLYASPASASTHVYVRIAPPIQVVETRPPAPHRGYVWRPGHHRYYHNRYTWVRGSWVRPPYSRARWVPGHWAQERRGYYWVQGHWTRW